MIRRIKSRQKENAMVSMAYNGKTTNNWNVNGVSCLYRVMANLGCRLGSPAKRKPKLKNCLHHVGLWVCLRGCFLDC